jgi:hypothetical protein
MVVLKSMHLLSLCSCSGLPYEAKLLALTSKDVTVKKFGFNEFIYIYIYIYICRLIYGLSKVGSNQRTYIPPPGKA